MKFLICSLICFCFFVQNPGYMKENFVIMIESFHIDDVGNQHNVCIKIYKNI